MSGDKAFGWPNYQATAGFVRPNIAVGSQYQLVFVTAGVRDATSSDIED